MSIESALIFGAGFGTRMGDITKITPKPMIRVLNKPLIDYAIDVILSANIQNISVNLHHLPKQIEDHLSKFENIQTIHEQPNILETGGGLKNALPIPGRPQRSVKSVIPAHGDVKYQGQWLGFIDCTNDCQQTWRAYPMRKQTWPYLLYRFITDGDLRRVRRSNSLGG